MAEGDMDKILDTVLCATVDDESRFRQILQKLIADGTVEEYPCFINEKKWKSAARKRKVKMSLCKWFIYLWWFVIAVTAFVTSVKLSYIDPG